jgi:hypothetical protein
MLKIDSRSRKLSQKCRQACENVSNFLSKDSPRDFIKNLPAIKQKEREREKNQVREK